MIVLRILQDLLSLQSQFFSLIRLEKQGTFGSSRIIQYFLVKSFVVVLIVVIGRIFRKRNIHKMLWKISNHLQSVLRLIPIQIDKNYSRMPILISFEIISNWQKLLTQRQLLIVVDQRYLRFILVLLRPMFLCIFDQGLVKKETVDRKTHGMHQISKLTHFRLGCYNRHMHFGLFYHIELLNYKYHESDSLLFPSVVHLRFHLLHIWMTMQYIRTDWVEKSENRFTAFL